MSSLMGEGRPEVWFKGRRYKLNLSYDTGREDAKTILEFYDTRYIEMCQEVIPFITDIVIPQVRKIAQSNKKQVLKSYNRKQRRALFAGRNRS